MTDTTKTEALTDALGKAFRMGKSTALVPNVAHMVEAEFAGLVLEQVAALSAVGAERDQARRAIRELEDKLGRADATADALRLCVASMQRDMEAPPGYLQDAVIKAAGLGALHHERDAARAERDRLAAECEALRAVAVQARDALASATGYISDQTSAGREIAEALSAITAAMGGKESQGGNDSGQQKEGA